MNIKKFFSQIKNKINFISFDVIVMYIFIGFVAFYTSDKVAKLYDFAPLYKLHSKVLSSVDSYNRFLITDAKNKKFIETGYSESVLQYNKRYGYILESIKLVLTDNLELDILSSQNKQDLDTVIIKIKLFKNKFKELQLLYKKRGDENNGISSSVITKQYEIREALLNTENKQIKEILLNNYKLNFLYVDEKELATQALNSNKELRNLIIAENSLSSTTEDSAKIAAENILLDIDYFSVQIKEFQKVNNDIVILTRELLKINKETTQSIITIKDQAINTIDSKVAMLNSIIILLIVFFSIVTFLVVKYIQKSIITPLQKIQIYTSKLALGKFPKKIKLKSEDEITVVLKSINTLIDGLRTKDEFAKEIGRGNLKIEIDQLSEDDTLSHSLEEMQKGLKTAHGERSIRQEEEQKQKWINSGIAEFATILRQDNDNLNLLGDNVIKNLVHYVSANQGGIFLFQKNEEGQDYMELIASYAFNRKKFITKKIEVGEGLIGNIALEQKMIHLHKLPADYLEITSGLGEAEPSDLVIIPLVYNDVFYGAVEIAAFEKLEEHKINFLIQITDNIASTFASVKTNMQTTQLLEQSNIQTENLASQEEEMRQNMEELQATQEEASRRELALQELVDAIDASNFVVEYNALGQVTRANKLVEDTLQLSNAEIIGKNINDFVDQSSDINQIWDKIMKGNIVKHTSKLKVNDKIIWLDETYTPIKDEYENIIKVIKFAFNITEIKKLEETIAEEKQTIKKQEFIMQKELAKLDEKEIELIQKNRELTQIKTTIDSVLYYAELNIEMEFLSINKRFLAALAYDQEDVIGQNHDFISVAQEKMSANDILTELRENNFFKIKTYKETKTGQQIYLFLTYSLLNENDGAKIVLFGHETLQKPN